MLFKKFCNKCNKDFRPTGKFSRYCDDCRAKANNKTVFNQKKKKEMKEMEERDQRIIERLKKRKKSETFK